MFHSKAKCNLSHLLLLFALQLVCLKNDAQNFSISGLVFDEKNEPLAGATISLLRVQDSLLLGGTQSDLDGHFKLENVNSSKFILKISFVGYNNYYEVKEIVSKSIILPPIALSLKTSLLGEVNILENINATQIKGDTIQYNAAAFKTNADANAEDLVTKMPGVDNVDGKVQAQGEELKKIMVDGKPFFGDDPNAVLKNLPAEMIDKILIFDGKSDQSQFTGFDDGNSIKTMNIITKPQYKDGIFGKVFAGFGNENRYKAGFNLNFFNGNKKLTFLCNTNNINEQNFSAEDLQPTQSNANSTSRNRGMRQGGKGAQTSDDNNFFIDQKNGINSTHAFGINFANKWNKIDFTSSYFVNFIGNESFNNKTRQNFSGSLEDFNYNEQNNLTIDNLNHRLNTRIDWKIDTSNSILLQPKISYQHTSGKSIVEGQNFEGFNLISGSNSKSNNSLAAINLSMPILYKHSFHKRGRTVSIGLTPTNNDIAANANLVSEIKSFDLSITTDSINQESDFNKTGFSISSNISYTEPLHKNAQLLLTASDNYNRSNSIKETYNLFGENERNLNNELSNNFTTILNTNNFGTTYSFTKKTWNFSTGVIYQIASLESQQIFPATFYLDRTFKNFLPNASAQIKFSESKNLRFNYRTNNTLPSADQLQNVINNINPLQLTAGNPLLVQNFQNNGSIRYSASNTEKNTSFFTMMGATITKNYFSNRTFLASNDSLVAPSVILLQGGQFTKPVNLNGYYSLRSYSNLGLPLNKIKCKLNLNAFITYSNTPSLINSALNFTKNLGYGGGVVISSNISKDFDFTISTSTTLNNLKNTLQNEMNNKSLNQNSKLKITAMPWKGLVLQSEMIHQYNNGLAISLNRNFILWNAAVGCKFMKEQLSELRLSIYDVLKQNDNISRITSETYFEDTQSNVLQRYVMLTFTYKIKYLKNTDPEN